MGIFDIFKRMSDKRESDKSAKDAMADVKRAAQASNYNQASVQAFYALQEIGRSYANIEREIYITAREYGNELAEGGNVSSEELEPIILNFEIAKYSPGEVTFEDYRNVEETLETVLKKYKSPSAKVRKAKGKAKKGKKRRRKPSKRATGAGARRRKRRTE
ncbi:MAG: hypothetical protein ACXAD7_22100 [Candidatus Kariarchaeaceae archaeon]|jgi:hypothetical protein